MNVGAHCPTKSDSCLRPMICMVSDPRIAPPAAARQIVRIREFAGSLPRPRSIGSLTLRVASAAFCVEPCMLRVVSSLRCDIGSDVYIAVHATRKIRARSSCRGAGNGAHGHAPRVFSGTHALMNAMLKASSAGAAGAVVTNVLHEVVRRSTPDAPRVDLLGMQGIARGMKSLGVDGPKGRALYGTTLAADLISNGAYFACVAAGKENALMTGALLGLAAGIGAVVLPGPMGFTAETTSRNGITSALSVLLYTAGGITAGLVYAALSGDDA